MMRHVLGKKINQTWDENNKQTVVKRTKCTRKETFKKSPGLTRQEHN